MRRTIPLALAACLTVAGCAGSSDGRDGRDDKATVTKASGSASARPAPGATPAPAPAMLAIGETADITFSEGELTATVLAFRDEGIRSDPDLLTQGHKWALVEARVCNKTARVVSVSPFTWTLAYADGVRVEPAHMSSGLPRPLYPVGAKVRAGDCVRGNITFEVPDEGRPERVLYSPEVVDEPVEWQLPEK